MIDSSPGAALEQLVLFESGGVDLAKLREAQIALKSGNRARGTLVMYASDWRQFEVWCRKAGRSPLPALTDTVGLYATWVLVERGCKVSTVRQHLAAIVHFHREAGYDSPVTRDVRCILTGVQRQRKEQPEGKAALDATDLLRVVRTCDRHTVKGAREHALIILGFATSLRRSELAALHLADVNFERKGLTVMVHSSKTDQEGKGRVIGVWAGKREITDPVRAMHNWISKRGRWEGPLFCQTRGDGILRAGLTGVTIAHVVKAAVARAGDLDPARYAAHSLRAGAATAAAEIGRSDREIMGLTGHESLQVMRKYIRHARVFSGRNPLEGVL